MCKAKKNNTCVSANPTDPNFRAYFTIAIFGQALLKGHLSKKKKKKNEMFCLPTYLPYNNVSENTCIFSWPSM